MDRIDNNPLAVVPVGKLFFKLAIPSVLAQVVNLLYNLIDRIFIGRISEVGSDALTGVGVCFPLIVLFRHYLEWEELLKLLLN